MKRGSGSLVEEDVRYLRLSVEKMREEKMKKVVSLFGFRSSG